MVLYFTGATNILHTFGGHAVIVFTVYIIHALAHMITFASASARENAVDRPLKLVLGWVGSYSVNIFVVARVFIVEFGFGGWASMVNFVHQIDTLVISRQDNKW